MGVQRFEMQSCYCEPTPGFPGGYAGLCPPGSEQESYDEGVAAFCAKCEEDPCAECLAEPPAYAKSFTYPGPSSWEPTPGVVAGGIGSSLCVTHGIMETYECYAIEPPPEGCAPPPPPPPPPGTPPPVPTDCLNGGGTDGEDVPPWEGGGQQD